MTLPEIHIPDSKDRLQEIAERQRKAQEQLMEIERERQELEAQRQALEELHRKQQELENGRKDLRMKLRRALALLQREEEALKLDAEQIAKTRIVFEDTLHSVQEIDPDSWDPAEYEDRLTEALSLLDHARITYNENRAKVSILQDEGIENLPEFTQDSEDEQPDARESDFFYWVKRGFAYNLPLVIIGIIIILLMLRN